MTLARHTRRFDRTRRTVEIAALAVLFLIAGGAVLTVLAAVTS